jgi:hypothetical protein
MQKYIRIYDYIEEYRRLVYDVYSKDAVAYLSTYYNLDSESTVWDDTDLFNGSYERIGELSGIKWNKILLLPVFFIDEITTVFDGKETGYLKDGETTIVIPSSYGITPYPGDLIKLDQTFLRETDDTYPIYIVKGVEISSNTDKRFWKLTIGVYHSSKTTDLVEQVDEIFSFVDYDKKIHTIDDANFLTKIMLKNENSRENIIELFDQNNGIYYI